MYANSSCISSDLESSSQIHYLMMGNPTLAGDHKIVLGKPVAFVGYTVSMNAFFFQNHLDIEFLVYCLESKRNHKLLQNPSPSAKKDNHPNWVIFFRGVETTNQLSKQVAFGQAEWNRIKSGWQMTKTGNSVRAGYTTWGLNKTSVRNNTVHCFTINRDDYARMHYNLLTRMGWWPSQAWSVWTYMSNFPVSVDLVVHEFQNSNATISTDRITICFFLVGSLIVFLNPSLFGQIDNYSELFPPLWANGKDKGKAWMQGQSGVSGERELQALQRMRCWPCHNP